MARTDSGEDDLESVRGALTEGPVGHHLASLAFAMGIAITVNITASLVDIYFIARIGTFELAAVAFTFSVTSIITSITFGIGIGTSSVVARTIGAGDMGLVRRLATDSVLLTLMASIVLMIIGIAAIDPVFTMLGASRDVLPFIQDYMRIWYLGLPFLVVPMVATNSIRATGDAKRPAVIMVAAAILQIALAPVLIFGLLGVPALGVEGAALALVISRIALAAATFYLLRYKSNLLVFARPAISDILHSWGRILHVGLPASATQMIGPVSIAIITRMIASYGDEAVAGFGVASRIESFSVLPLFALSACIGPIIGQNSAAGLKPRVERAMALSYRFSFLWGLGVALLMIPFASTLAGFFDDNQKVVDYAATYLWIFPVSYCMWGVLMMASASFNSLGRPIPSTVMAGMRMLGLYVPLALIGRYFFGVAGIFGAGALANILIGASGYFWSRKNIRERH